MKTPCRTALAAVALLALCGAAHAEFVIDAGGARVARVGPSAETRTAETRTVGPRAGDAPSSPSSRVHDAGTPPDFIPRAEGWANEVPVALALKQVVPAGWTVRLDKADGRSVDESRVVSWSGGRPWPVVLGDLAQRGRFEATVRWSEKLVVVCPEPPPPTTLSGMGSSGVSRADVSSEAVVKHSVSTPAPMMAPVPPPPPPVMQWHLDPKRTLRENVEDWTRQAGWNRVIWEAADYPIAAQATFTGDFVSPAGPLATLIGAYDSSDQPLLVELSTMDKVVHVTNRNYHPVVVDPQTAQQFDPPSFKEEGRDDRGKHP